MAEKLWEQEIDKTVDWGGDNSTGGAAVSGQFVQKFIKDTLAKKFGYLHYDRTALKYYVFADEDDYNKYANDTTGEHAGLLLATFDAPAPASISVDETSRQMVTILSSEKGQELYFRYIVKDSGQNPITEAVQARIVFNNGGTITQVIQNFPVDFDNYQDGIPKYINIDNYLTVGTNNITVTLTGVSTQATTTLNFVYTVVELLLNSSFDNKKGVEFDSALGLDDNYFTIPYSISGQGEKYMEWYVNGKPLNQSWVPEEYGALSTTATDGYMASKNPEYSSNMSIYLTNDLGELNPIFNLGKNTIQFRMYVENKDGSRLYSMTKYYDFVIVDKNKPMNMTYILYSQDLGSGALFTPEDTISFKTQQYSSTSFNYGLFSTSGAATTLEFVLTKTEGETTENVASMMRSISSGEEQMFEYVFLTYGNIDININTLSKDTNGNPLDSMHIVVEVAKSAAQIAVTKESLVLNLEAQNRSNSEPNPATWNYRNVNVQFNNVLWNDTSGWDGKALVLNSGATAFIPFNVFDNYTNSGLTFEVDFETFNVQDENAVILSVRDKANRSHIEVSACGCSVGDMSPAGVVTGNFKDNERLKLAFIVGNYKENYDQTVDLYANKTFIIMNGILDRATTFGGSIKWNNPENPGIVIGDPNGKAGVKIRSIRVYNKALSLDDELTNFIAESDNLLEMYDRNNIYVEGTNSISLDIVKNTIPTMVMYGDVDILNTATNKKNNAEFDVEFYDPTDPNIDFYARGAWVSCQGTSSMFYPKKNFRLYFGKTNDGKTLDGSAKYWTEFYRAGEFTHGELNDYNKLGQFQCNKKTCEDKYHKLYNHQEAEVLESRGNLLYYKAATGDFYPCSYGDGSTNEYYVPMYQPLRDWLTVKQFRYSGATLYKIDGYSKIQNPVTGVEYDVPEFKKLKGKNALKEDTTYYVDQACWKQYEGSGWTNRWTLKTDFAESSMTHNAGAGRLWGNAMKMVQGTDDSGKTGYLCRTLAQTRMGELADGIDIRTSCDGKPIVIFACPLVRDEAGNVQYDENGFRKYGNAEFVGQFNIMTDKGSTKLFGFEDIYDENGNKIFSAEKVECWEASNNGSLFGQGVNLITDVHAAAGEEENTFMGTRFVMSDYEPRWPDVEIEGPDGDEYLVAHTHNIESMWRFVHFCKPGVDYLVDGLDGYTLSPYVEIPEAEYDKAVEDGLLVFVLDQRQLEEAGNKVYNNLEYKDSDDLRANAPVYKMLTNIDYENVTKTVSTKTIENHIYKGRVASFDATYGTFVEDIAFDDERVGDGEQVNYGDKIAGSPFEEDYYVSVYLEAAGGNKYNYTDNYGQQKQYVGSVDRDAYEVGKDGKSFAGRTYMEYFSEKKYDYFDVWKLAAYYIYLMRFAGIDQVVKNSMLTTEDGQHYYYINYDNDTTLGVRNDGHIVFHWTVDRNTYDYSKGQFAYAGPTSVLWNLLENDTDFMNKVKQLDTAMYNSGVLSSKVLLDMYNNKQAAWWPERMYNVQETIKYLPSGAGYLNFIHGSRTQHRTWWVTNRFNLYDSKWFSGEYSQNTIKFYMGIKNENASIYTDILSITAARQNVFGLTNSDLDGAVPEHWAKEMAIDSTWDWTTNSTWNGISSPFSIMGVDKIKVLDFRKAVEAGHSFGKLEFIGNIANNWIKSKGTMMTKLLFGISDEFRTSDVYRYTNKTENAIVMTVGGNEITINAGEYYDAPQAVNAPDGLSLEILGPTRCNVALLSNMNDLNTLEEVDIRNCFNDSEEYHLGDFKINNLASLHVYRAIGSSITTFKPAEGVILNEVSLPVNRISDIELRNVTFTPAAEQTAEVFKYTPDAALKNVVLRNVTGIDIVKFVNDWDAALTEANVPHKSCNLTLENINCENVPVDFVMNVVDKFNLLNFTGTLSLISSIEDRQLTKEQYDAIVEKYGANVFSTGSALRFSADEGMFWSSSMEWNDDIDNKPQHMPAMCTEGWYEGIHETEYTFKCTKFPVNEGETMWYEAWYIPANGGNPVKLNYVNGTHNINNATGNPGPAVPCLQLTYDSNTSSCTFKSLFNGNSTRNRQQIFVLYPVINGDTDADNAIYITLKEVHVVTDFKLVCDNEHIGTLESDTVSLEDNKDHKFSIELLPNNTINVPIKTFRVTLDPADSASLKVSTVVNKDLTQCSFTLTPSFIPQTVTITANIYVLFDTEYDNKMGVGCPINKQVTFIVNPVYANEFDLLDAEGNVVEDKTILLNEADKTFNYTIRPYNTQYYEVWGEYYYNIPVESSVIGNYDLNVNNRTSIEIDKNNPLSMVVKVRSNKSGKTYLSFNDEDEFTLTIKHLGDATLENGNGVHDFTKDCTIDSQIVYPEVINILSVDKDENIESKMPTKLAAEAGDSKVIEYKVSLTAQSVAEDVSYPCTFSCVPEYFTDNTFTTVANAPMAGFSVEYVNNDNWQDARVRVVIPHIGESTIDLEQSIILHCAARYEVGTDVINVTKDIQFTAVSSLASYGSPKECNPGTYFIDNYGLIYNLDAIDKMGDSSKLIGVLYVSPSIPKNHLPIAQFTGNDGKDVIGYESSDATINAQHAAIQKSGLIIKPNYIAIPLDYVRTNDYCFLPNVESSDLTTEDWELLNDFCNGWNTANNNLANIKKMYYGASSGLKDYLDEINKVSVSSGNPKYASSYNVESSGESECLTKSWISGKFLSNAICNEWITEFWNRNNNKNNANGEPSNWSFNDIEGLAEKEWPALAGSGTLRMAIPYFRNLFKVEGINSILKCFVGSKEEYLLLLEGLESIKDTVALLRGEDPEGTIIQSINEMLANVNNYILTASLLNVKQKEDLTVGGIIAPVAFAPLKSAVDGENVALTINNSEILAISFSTKAIYQTPFNSLPFIEI